MIGQGQEFNLNMPYRKKIMQAIEVATNVGCQPITYSIEI